MKLHEPYEPKKQKNAAVIVAAVMFTLVVGAMWALRKRLMIETPDLMIYSGCALFLILFTAVDIRRKHENYEQAQALRKQQDEIGTDSYSDSGIFFRNEK